MTKNRLTIDWTSEDVEVIDDEIKFIEDPVPRLVS